MKLLRLFLLVLLFLALSLPALYDCVAGQLPKDGVYQTSDGTLLKGHASEAWCAGAGPGVPGNTENAMSWDAGVLGAQWRVWGMTIDENGAVETGRYFDAFGNGWIDYTTNYEGGQFWLSKNHIWGDGTTDYTGTLTYYNVNSRVSFAGGQMVGVTSNVYFTGGFDACSNCKLNYVITNAMLVWQTGWLHMPCDFPPFLCGATEGEYYDVCCIRAQILCSSVPVESTTWGVIKALFR